MCTSDFYREIYETQQGGSGDFDEAALADDDKEVRDHE